jgi:hypothetical protein
MMADCLAHRLRIHTGAGWEEGARRVNVHPCRQCGSRCAKLGAPRGCAAYARRATLKHRRGGGARAKLTTCGKWTQMQAGFFARGLNSGAVYGAKACICGSEVHKLAILHTALPAKIQAPECNNEILLFRAGLCEPTRMTGLA